MMNAPRKADTASDAPRVSDRLAMPHASADVLKMER
jgi:hypothetical protein